MSEVERVAGVLARELDWLPHEVWLREDQRLDLAKKIVGAPVEGPLNEMARQFDWWRRFDREKRDKEGLETTDETAIIAPPSWPSHGILKAWSEALDRAAPQQPRPASEPPPDGTRVLVWSDTPITVDRSGGWQMATYYKQFPLSGERWVTDDGYWAGGVTHWMPMPEPPPP